MIRSALFGFCALAVVATAAPAASPDPKAMRKALADYGKCIVKREPNKTREFIMGGGFITRRDRDESILLSPECMPGEEMIRAGLAARGGTASRARLRLP
ncbi:MAG: hypothetical protein GXC70_04430, partial [Sphingomonadaceae bacterium]|nr:hypothetical protein [Sphingomonadaceae bacterium]